MIVAGCLAATLQSVPPSGILPPPAGFDPAVLQGARKLLAAKRAAVVYFEYNVWNLWASTALKDVIAQLEHYDYNCYFEGDRLCNCCQWSCRPSTIPCPSAAVHEGMSIASG
jgi:hypothetical protein